MDELLETITIFSVLDGDRVGIEMDHPFIHFQSTQR